MLSELDVAIFLKSNDDLDRVAARVFGALDSQYMPGPSEAGIESYEAQGMGMKAMLYANAGEFQDPEFADYAFTLEITSRFADVELDQIDFEGLLSEYYARLLAFDLNLETATAVMVEEREDAEVLELRAFARNTQYRSDSGPTVPKAHVVETREIEVPLSDEGWDATGSSADDVEANQL
jgi:hypothetical protein